jgi:hypothetical protein
MQGLTFVLPHRPSQRVLTFRFRTVIISKLTYAYGDREGSLFAKSDFRNMSGRAGRLGHHEDGRVILMPKNSAELRHRIIWFRLRTTGCNRSS